MEVTIQDLPCNETTKSDLLEVLERFGITNLYQKIFKKMNEPYYVSQGVFFISSYEKQDYMTKDPLAEISKSLGAEGLTENLLSTYIHSIIDALSLPEAVAKYPDITYDIIERMYFQTDNFIKCMNYVNKKSNLFLPAHLSKQLQVIIPTVKELTSQSLLINIKLNYIVKHLIGAEGLDKEEKIIVAQKVVQFYKNLHSIRGTRLCFLDTESTGLNHPLPIQISYLLLDINLKYLDSKNYYVKQDYIESGAVAIHGISKRDLLNQYDSIEPDEALEAIRNVLKDPKVILIGHNIGYDIRVLHNLSKQCDERLDFTNQTFCTFYRHNDYITNKLRNYELGTILDSVGITEEDVQDVAIGFFRCAQEGIHSHNAVFDVLAVYLILLRTGFLGGD